MLFLIIAPDTDIIMNFLISLLCKILHNIMKLLEGRRDH